MGLFDSFAQGETGGMPDLTGNNQPVFGGGLLNGINGNNPLLNIGLGILANNHGHYGAFAPAFGQGVQQGIQNNQQAQQLAQQKLLQDLRMKQYQAEMLKQQQTDVSDKAYSDSFNSAVTPATNVANQSFQEANNTAMQGSPAMPMAGNVGDNLSPQDTTTPYSVNQTAPAGFDKQAFMQAVLSNPNISADKKMAVLQSMQKDNTPLKVSAGETFVDPNTFKPLYTAPDKQNFNQPFNSDGSPNTAYQEYEKTKGKDANPFFSAQQTPDGLISFDSRTGNATPVIINGQRVIGGKAAAGTTLSPEALDVAAENYRKGLGLPALGMSGAADKKAIMNRAGALDAADGVSGADGSTNQVTGKATIGGINQLQKQYTMVSAFEKTAKLNGALALDLSNKVDRTGTPILNQWLQAGQKNVTGNPEVSAFHAANETFINEYAKIMSGSMGNTAVSDSARAGAHSLLSTAHTKEQYKAVMNQLNAEMENRIKGFGDQLQENTKSFNHKMPTNNFNTGYPVTWGAPGTTVQDAKEGVTGESSIQLKPIPLPAKTKASALKKGSIYATPKGSLRWNGLKFEDM